MSLSVVLQLRYSDNFGTTRILKTLQLVIATMKLKDTPWKESYD